MDILFEKTKTVTTVGNDNLPNGYITELFKGADGNSTEIILTVAYPGKKKGYHAYKNRTMRFVCVVGRIAVHTVNLITGKEDYWVLHEASKITISPNHAILLDNSVLKESAYIISYPDPPYMPGTDEQFKLSYEQVMQIVKDKSWNENS